MESEVLSFSLLKIQIFLLNIFGSIIIMIFFLVTIDFFSNYKKKGQFLIDYYYMDKLKNNYFVTIRRENISPTKISRF